MHLEDPSLASSKISKALKCSKSTVTRLVRRLRKGESIERKPGSGRKSGFADKELFERVKKSYQEDPELPHTQRAKLLGSSRKKEKKMFTHSQDN